MFDQREPYVKDEQFTDLAQRVRFTKGGREAAISRLKEPKVKPWKPARHHLDNKASPIGMRGAEVQALHQAVLDNLDNPMIAKKYRELLMVVKLTVPQALEQVHEADRVERDRYERTEQDRIKAINNHAAKIKVIQNNWDEVAGSVEARFRKMIKSLIAMARKEPDMSTMDRSDRAFIHYLVAHGLAITDPAKGMLVEIAPSLLEKDRTWIEDFFEGLLDYMVDEGCLSQTILKDR